MCRNDYHTFRTASSKPKITAPLYHRIREITGVLSSHNVSIFIFYFFSVSNKVWELFLLSGSRGNCSWMFMSTGTRLLAVGMSAFTVSSKWRCSCCRTDKHRIMQSVPTKQAAVAIIIGFKFQAVQLLQCLFLSIILTQS